MAGNPASTASVGRQAPRRAEIRDGAARVFARRGYHGASVQEIADAIGLTKASLYYYYKSKEEMLADILSFADTEVGAVLEAKASDRSGPLERIGAFVAAHVTWYLQHPDIAKVAFRDWGELSGEALDVQIERRRRYSHMLRDGIEQCRREGLIADDANVTLLANFINGAVAATNVWFNPAGRDRPEDVGKAFGRMAMAIVASDMSAKGDSA